MDELQYSLFLWQIYVIRKMMCSISDVNWMHMLVNMGTGDVKIAL